MEKLGQAREGSVSGAKDVMDALPESRSHCQGPYNQDPTSSLKDPVWWECSPHWTDEETEA